MNEFKQKIANTVHAAVFEQWGVILTSGDPEKLVDAILDAMFVPTDMMRADGATAINRSTEAHALNCWQAMIQEAKK